MLRVLRVGSRMEPVSAFNTADVKISGLIFSDMYLNGDKIVKINTFILLKISLTKMV